MVGVQIGGEPSGDGLNMGLSERHSSGQHVGHPRSGGTGSTLQSGLLMFGSVQSGGRSGSLSGKKQVSYGHSSITSEHSDGAALGDGEGTPLGAGVGGRVGNSLGISEG